MNINWHDPLPYNHAGTWEKKIDSIMNPGAKVTWPQFVAEMVVYWRCEFLKDYKDIKKGLGWSSQIQKHVRDLNQQSSAICNYFPHIDNDKLVIAAFKNFFRKAKPLKIGQFRKVRSVEKNNRKSCNITQAEKDIVVGIMTEYEKLKEQRSIFAQVAPKDNKSPEDIKFKTIINDKKNKLSSLLELEQKLMKEKNG